MAIEDSKKYKEIKITTVPIWGYCARCGTYGFKLQKTSHGELCPVCIDITFKTFEQEHNTK